MNHAQTRFLAWTKRNYPMVWARTAPQFGLAGLGTVVQHQGIIPPKESPKWYESFTAAIGSGLQMYAGYRATRSLYDINLERARQNLPPLDSAAVAPTVRVQHEVASPGGLPVWVWPVAGVGLVLLLAARK